MRFNTTNFRTNTILLCGAGKHRSNGYFVISALPRNQDILGYSKFALGWRHVQRSKIDRFRRSGMNYDI